MSPYDIVATACASWLVPFCCWCWWHHSLEHHNGGTTSGVSGSAAAGVGRGEARSQCLCHDQDCQYPKYHYCRRWWVGGSGQSYMCLCGWKDRIADPAAAVWFPVVIDSVVTGGHGYLHYLPWCSKVIWGCGLWPRVQKCWHSLLCSLVLPPFMCSRPPNFRFTDEWNSSALGCVGLNHLLLSYGCFTVIDWRERDKRRLSYHYDTDVLFKIAWLILDMLLLRMC